MEDLTGKQLGPYQILSPLGEGGMAAVYKAYQPRMERYVAMKILPRHFASDPEFVSRFSQEARVIANLQHPHILPVHDFGEADGYTYLVMRFIEGGSLIGWFKERQPVSMEKVVSVITQVGGALAYAHSQGVIHRDIKPGNVLVDKWDNCLLTDFGLAKIVESSAHLTQTGGILGTPAYMSPEQGLGRQIDHRSDIYSLGVVLYQMAVGSLPYEAETPMAVVIKHIHDPLPPPRQRNAAIPEAVELVILRALAKKPADRYATAGDMVNALAEATAGTPAAYVPPPATPPTEPRPDEAATLARRAAVAPDAMEAMEPTELWVEEEQAASEPVPVDIVPEEAASAQAVSGPVEELQTTEPVPGDLAPTELLSEAMAPTEIASPESAAPVPPATRVSAEPGSTPEKEPSTAPPMAVAQPAGKSRLPVILAGVAGVIVVGLIILFASGAFSSGDDEDESGVAAATPLPTPATSGQLPTAGDSGLDETGPSSESPPAGQEGDQPPPEEDPRFLEELTAQIDQAYMEDDMPRVLALIDEGLAQVPASAELHCQRGYALNGMEAKEEAAASFEQCLALAQEQGLADLRLEARGQLAVTQAHFAAQDQEDLGRALAILEEAYSDPFAPGWLHCERAELLLEADERPGAIEEYETCLVGEESDSWWWTRYYQVRGEQNLEDEDYGAAREMFSAWSELEPEYPWPFCFLGEAFTGLGQFEQAIGAFERCRELSNDEEDAAQWATTGIFATQAYQAEAEGRLLTALESFDQALGESPDEAWLHCERGRLLMAMEAYEESRNSLQACLELSEDDPGTREWAEALLEELGTHLP